MEEIQEEKLFMWGIDEKEKQNYLKTTFASICEAVYNADGDWERDE